MPGGGDGSGGSDTRPARPGAGRRACASPTAGPEELAGTLCGAYRLVSVIASGGFGTVYRGEHRHTESEVAVKVLHAEMVQFEDAVIRFEREARAIQAVRHPHVVEILELGELEDGRPYIAMELLHGSDLDQLIERRGRLTPTDVGSLLQGLCSALAVAHEAAIVHRDVKASNVVLRGDDPEHPVLLDFGIAKLLNNDPQLTSSRHALGTPTSMAPEQIRGQAVDARTDVYAVGALMYHALTGELLFYDPSVAVMHDLHMHAARPRPSSRAPGAAVLDEVVLRALAPDPDDRFPGATELLDAALTAVTGTRRAAALDGRALAVRIEVELDEALGDDPEDAVLDAFDSVVPASRRALVAAGFAVELETGNSLLACRILASERVSERAEAVRAVCELLRDLERASGMVIAAMVAAGPVHRVGGSLAGPPLDELDQRWPENPQAGLLVTRGAARGLELELTPAAGGLWRVLDPGCA